MVGAETVDEQCCELKPHSEPPVGGGRHALHAPRFLDGGRLRGARPGDQAGDRRGERARHVGGRDARHVQAPDRRALDAHGDRRHRDEGLGLDDLAQRRREIRSRREGGQHGGLERERPRHGGRPRPRASNPLDDEGAHHEPDAEAEERHERAERRPALLLPEVQAQQHGIAGHVRGEDAAEPEIADRVDIAGRPGEYQEHEIALVSAYPRLARIVVHGAALRRPRRHGHEAGGRRFIVRRAVPAPTVFSRARRAARDRRGRPPGWAARR